MDTPIHILTKMAKKTEKPEEEKVPTPIEINPFKMNTGKMYRPRLPYSSSIKRNDSREGESIELKMERITENKEPITEGAPMIYTPRAEGVQPAYNIRSDRFDIAIDGMDKVNRAKLAEREGKADLKIVKKDDGGAEPIQGTEPSN